MAGQSVGDLFINLGIQGAEKTLGAVQGVRQGLADVTSTSLATKAAIVGAFYALEQLFTRSGQFGIALTNSKTLIGETGKSIQQYENYAQHMGAANGSMTATLLKLKSAMVDLKYKGTAPEGMFWIHAVLGNAKVSDIDKYIQHPHILLQRLGEYARKEKVPGLGQDRLKSFINDQNIIAGLMQGKYQESDISKEPFLNDAAIARLEKTGEAWNKLGIDIDMAFKHFGSFHGAEIAAQIDKLVAPTLKLAENLERIAQNIGVFRLMGKSIGGLADATDLLGSSAEEQRRKFHQEKGSASRQSLGGFLAGLTSPSLGHGSRQYQIQQLNQQIHLHGVGPVIDPKVYGEMIGKHSANMLKDAVQNLDQSTVK